MPLKKDGNYRGPHASHVKGHRKLGKHRTVITAAMPLIDWLLEQTFVRKVELGRVVNASAKNFAPRVECSAQGKKIKLLLVSSEAAQRFDVMVATDGAVHELTRVIPIRWNALQGSGLKAVE